MTSTATLKLSNWCENPYRDARAAILGVDLTVQSSPDDALNTLLTVATAIHLLTGSKGIPAAHWLPVMAQFHKLSRTDLARVMDAVEMRMRSFERLAA